MAGQYVLTFSEVPTAPKCRASDNRLPATKRLPEVQKIFILFHCPLDGKQFKLRFLGIFLLRLNGLVVMIVGAGGGEA